MAIPTDTTWEVQSGGSDSNGGGFSVAQKGATGTDKTYPTSSPTTFTSTLSATGTTSLTDSGAGFSNTMLGNLVNIVGQGTYCIQGFTSSSIVTVDRALGTFSTTTGVVGGARLTMGSVGSIMTVGNVLYLKSATYSITSATANIAGGCLSIPAQTGANSGKLIGYTTTRGDLGRPTIQASGISTFTLVTANAGNSLENLILDGASLTSSRGAVASNGRAYNCKVINCTNSGISGGHLVYCEATTCSGASTGGFISSALAFRCVSHDNTSSCSGFLGSSNIIIIDCIAYSNNGAGFSDGGAVMQLINCTAYGNTGDGFKFLTSGGNAVSNGHNLLSYGNTGWGINSATNLGTYVFNCFLGSNTAGPTTGSVNITGQVNLSADPFTNKAGQDFSLNTTAGGGAAVRAAGLPGVFPGISTTAYLDGGAVQHQDPVSGAGAILSRTRTGF